MEKGTSQVSDDSESSEPDGRVTDGRETEEERDGDIAEADVATTAADAKEARRISLSVRGLVVGVVIAALAVGLGVMTWLYVGADHKLDSQVQQARDDQHAEQVALDYAVRAAIMDYKDLGPWKRALVDGTTPELGKKLTDAANAMEQILLPLQWSSTAKPIAAKVRSHDKGVYVVDSFVSVRTKTAQSPDNLQSTATYAVTIDPSNGWKITDVGGIGQVVGDR